MAKCPNCGQITDGADCHWCKYPLRPLRVQKNQGVSEAVEADETSSQTSIGVIEQAAHDLEEAKKALETEIAAWEKNRLQAEEAKKVAEAEEAKEAARAEEEAGISDEMAEPGETGIADEPKKVLDKNDSIAEVLPETEEVKVFTDAENGIPLADGNLTSVVADVNRPKNYREIVEPIASLPVTRVQFKNLEKYLDMVESINRDLNKKSIGTKEAIKRLRDITVYTS